MLNATAESLNNSSDTQGFLANAQRAGDLKVVYLGTAEGEMLMSDPNESLPSGYDPRVRPWYKKAKIEGKLTITAPYMDAASGELIVTVAKPIPQGVLAADMSIKMLVDSILQSKSEGTQAILVDKNGLLVAHPDSSLTLKQTTRINSSLTPAKIQPISNNQVMEAMEVSGVSSLVRFQAIPGSDWYLGLIINKSVAFAAVKKVTLNAVLTSMIQFIVITLIAFLVISQLLKPLNVLNVALNDLAQGDGDLTKRVALARQDEIGRLGHSVYAFVH